MSLTPRILVDYTGPVRMSIDESSTDGSLVVEGKCGQCDTPTANGRVYGRQIMEREIKKLKAKVANNSAVGSVDHPGDGKSRITDIGHMIKDIWIESDGSVHGKFKIIEGTSKGKDLAAVLRAGVAVGMSSRGLGSTTPVGANGQMCVGEDFKLSTFDFVVEPAVSDAFPKIFAEDVNSASVSAEDLRAKFPDLVREIEEGAYSIAQDITESVLRNEAEDTKDQTIKKYVDEAIESQKDSIRQSVVSEERENLLDEFGIKLVRALQTQRQEIEESVRSEVSADPSVAGAKLTLEKVCSLVNPFVPTGDAAAQLAEKDNIINELTELEDKFNSEQEVLNSRVEEAEARARQLGYQLYVEKAVAGRKDADTIREMLGNLEDIDSPEQLQEKLVSAIKRANQIIETAEKEFNDARDIQEAKLEQLRAKNKQYRQMVEDEKEKFAGKLSKLSEDLEAKLERFGSELTAKDSAIVKERAKINKLQEALEVSADTIETLRLKSYAEQRTVGHPNRDGILRQIDEGRVSSSKEVNKLAESTGFVGQEPGGLPERMRRLFSRGQESPRDEDILIESRPGYIQGFDQLGLNLEDMKAPLGSRGNK